MKKTVSIIICFVICLSFAGCSLNIQSVDSLMRPPKLSGKNSMLQQSFEKTVDYSSSVVMKTPMSGDNRSSYLLFDLDNDSVSEALVLYSDPSKDSVAFVNVFKFVNDKWSLVSKIKGRSEEIYSVDFADINGDNNYEILISWAPSSIQNDSLASIGLNDKTLAIYSYNGSSITLRKTEPYSKLLIKDINNDRADDLFILNISLSNQDKVTRGRIVSFDNEYSIVQDVKFNLTGMLDVFNIVSDTYVTENENHSRVYVDGNISENGFITEVIDIEQSSFNVTLPLYESNTSSQPVTLRDTRVSSYDFDNDGVIEIPTVEKLKGSIRIFENSEDNSSLNLTVWSYVEDNNIVIDKKCLFNSTYGYMFIFTDEWLSSVSAIYNEKEAEITFYSLDDNGKLLNPLFSFKTFYELDWNKNSRGYTKFDTNGVFVYGYSISDTENGEEYYNMIKNNLILINQE